MTSLFDLIAVVNKTLYQSLCKVDQGCVHAESDTAKDSYKYPNPSHPLLSMCSLHWHDDLRSLFRLATTIYGHGPHIAPWLLIVITRI